MPLRDQASKLAIRAIPSSWILRRQNICSHTRVDDCNAFLLRHVDTV